VIELVIADRCTGCNACVEVCPTNVFDPGSDGRPAIARQADCQTCFLCELYCKTDALFVGADCEAAGVFNPARAAPTLGQYRRDSGWDEFAGDPAHANEHWCMESVFLRARELSRGR